MGNLDCSQAVFDALQGCLVERRIHAGFSLLDAFLQQDTFEPASLEAGIPILFSLAQWIDLGYKTSLALEDLLAGLAGKSRAELPARDFLLLRMVESLHCMRTQNFSRAVLLLHPVLGCEDEVLSPYEAFVAHFWMGRAQRLAGDFQASLLHIERALKVASTINASKLVAVARVHESWLVFHKGECEHALRLLDLAEAELQSTGHDLSLANIAAARGRFIRSSGQYTEALRHFNLAIAIYRVDHAEHPNLARAFVNAAYVKRLQALELQPASRGGAASSATHKLSQRITGEALAMLEQAAAIYQHQQHGGGTGAVLVNRGYLHLESGDIEQAALSADTAYRTGEQRADIVLMARAGILRSSVEIALSEEQLDEQAEPGAHAALAVRHAENAILLAAQTQNRRLLAAAYIVRGMVAADESNQEWTLARAYAGKASALLGPHEQDHLSRELRSLTLCISRSAAVDETLRAWSEGDLAGRSFQQVQVEFAEIVISKVWIKLDKRVSRVALELSISPKKVRRLLRSARHTDLLSPPQPVGKQKRIRKVAAVRTPEQRLDM